MLLLNILDVNGLLFKHQIGGCLTVKLNGLIERHCCHYTETSQLICRVNQLIGFNMTATLAFN